MAKTIAFRGKEKADFPYYIAKSLAVNGFTVAVFDNSYSKELYNSIRQYDKAEEEVIIKENIVYIKDAMANEEFTDKFDFVIYYMGINPKEISTQYSFVITDYTNTCVHFVKSLTEDILTDSYFIFRDKISNKITERNLVFEFAINEEQVLGVIPMEIHDEIAYQSFTYNGRQRIKELSNTMQYAIMTVLSHVTGDSINEVKKYYRKAKRNKRM